jgi:hypothetical protein
MRWSQAVRSASASGQAIAMTGLVCLQRRPRAGDRVSGDRLTPRLPDSYVLLGGPSSCGTWSRGWQVANGLEPLARTERDLLVGTVGGGLLSREFILLVKAQLPGPPAVLDSLSDDPLF